MDERLQQWEQALTEHGVRITPQREAILRYLVQARNHPTAYEVYDAVRRVFPRVSKATVYNTLNLMARLGLIIELRRQGGAVRYETNLTPHINMICLRCGRVIDAPTPVAVDLESLEGFQARHVRVDVYGYCAACLIPNRETTPQTTESKGGTG